MKQILIHGRGGQGAKLAGEIILETFFRLGRNVQGMPLYTGAKMGQAIVYSIKTDPTGDRSIPTSHIDGIVVLHPNLLSPGITKNANPGCFVLINTPQSLEAFEGLADVVACVDANRIAREHGLVKANVPMVSTTIVGAFTRVSELFAFDDVRETIRSFMGKRADVNIEVAALAYENVRVLERKPHG